MPVFDDTVMVPPIAYVPVGKYLSATVAPAAVVFAEIVNVLGNVTAPMAVTAAVVLGYLYLVSLADC